MYIEMKGTGERSHVAQNVGLTLIAAGLATAVENVVTKPKPTPNLKWAAVTGPREGDYQHPPEVRHSCSTCATNGYTTSFKGTAHTSARIFHCGIVETCPADVADRYKELFAAWKSRSRQTRPPQDQPSAGYSIVGGLKRNYTTADLDKQPRTLPKVK